MIDLPTWIETIRNYGIPTVGFFVLSLWLAVRFYNKWIPRIVRIIEDMEKLRASREEYKKELLELVSGKLSSVAEKCELVAKRTSDKHWNECKEARCPKIDEFSVRVHQRLDEHEKSLHSFFESGAVGRTETLALITMIKEDIADTKKAVSEFITNFALFHLKKERTLREKSDDAN